MPPKLVQVPYAAIGHVWPESERHLRRAYDRMGGDTPERMRERLDNREADLWCVYDGRYMLAAALAGIKGHTAVVNAVAGRDLSRWVHLLGEFETLAREHGLTDIEIEGREGWVRALRRAGYRQKRVILGKAL